MRLLLDQGLPSFTVHHPVAAGAFFSSRISMAISGKALAIDFFAISDAKDQNYQTIVFDLADEPVVAHAIFPKLPKP